VREAFDQEGRHPLRRQHADLDHLVALPLQAAYDLLEPQLRAAALGDAVG
jgi:hypothetical protein